MIKHSIILTGFLISACSYISSNKTAAEISGLPKTIILANSNIEVSENKIFGTWTNGKSKNATFEIREDSICYVDHFKCYKYSIKKDSIEILYEGFLYKGKIDFKSDTLLITSKSDVSKFWKF